MLLSNRIADLMPPPRRLPFRVICRVMLGSIGTVLGGLFLIVGLPFTWIFTADLRPLDEVLLALSTETTQGVITEITATNASENDVTIYRYGFEFTTQGEQRVTAYNYATGRHWSTGDPVLIRYVPTKPSVARMEEARGSRFPALATFVLIFPALGAVFFAAATRSAWRQVTLLRHGVIADGQMLSQQMTNLRINEVPVVKYSYEFQAHDGESYLGEAKALPTGRVGDEAREPVLYLPWKPRVSTLVDAVPVRYQLDVGSFGEWITREGIGAVVWYSLIWLGILASVAYSLLHALGAI